jgi:hypothetical protein
MRLLYILHTKQRRRNKKESVHYYVHNVVENILLLLQVIWEREFVSLQYVSSNRTPYYRNIHQITKYDYALNEVIFLKKYKK